MREQTEEGQRPPVVNERERFEALLSVLADLRDANRTMPILVEGLRDVATLRALGCEGQVLTVNNGRGLFGVAEDVSRSASHVIVFTDWDRRGAQICDQLTQSIQANGATAVTSFRERISEWVKLQVKDVEALLPYVTRGLHKFHRTTLEDHRRGLAIG